MPHRVTFCALQRVLTNHRYSTVAPHFLRTSFVQSGLVQSLPCVQRCSSLQASLVYLNLGGTFFSTRLLFTFQLTFFYSLLVGTPFLSSIPRGAHELECGSSYSTYDELLRPGLNLPLSTGFSPRAQASLAFSSSFLFGGELECNKGQVQCQCQDGGSTLQSKHPAFEMRVQHQTARTKTLVTRFTRALPTRLIPGLRDSNLFETHSDCRTRALRFRNVPTQGMKKQKIKLMMYLHYVHRVE
ncbi:hypothetical protein C8R47DRAFT_2427 [Mycena vitilis]|nr:hypothetical protein C8R47DRAFT_2427 [Mycena vitilis]